MTVSPTHTAIEAVFRIEAPKLIAALARMLGDVGVAEELSQEALVVALERWPETGVPDKPGAWLMATAKNRATDELRKRRSWRRREDDVGREIDRRHEASARSAEAALADIVPDDLLRLIFVACHPVLPRDARVALTLRLLGGLSTDEIGRAFLVAEATIAQRIVRAKRTLAEAEVPFEIPPPHELRDRLASVLEVVYLVFNEGYSATAGDDWMRPSLCEDALRLGRILAELAPSEPEVHGLVALMEIQASRTAARTGPSGEPVRLLDQARGKWDRILIGRGLSAIARAETLLGGAPRGSYLLEASIAACHARAPTAEATDWAKIVELYGELAERTGSPVVRLNRAVAVSMAQGPGPALALVEELASHPALADYHFVPAVRGDLLAKLGRSAEARAEFERAAGMTRNAKERELLLARAAALG